MAVRFRGNLGESVFFFLKALSMKLATSQWEKNPNDYYSYGNQGEDGYWTDSSVKLATEGNWKSELFSHIRFFDSIKIDRHTLQVSDVHEFA